MGPICKYYKRCKTPMTNMGRICTYCKECKKLMATMGPYGGIVTNVK